MSHMPREERVVRRREQLTVFTVAATGIVSREGQ